MDPERKSGGLSGILSIGAGRCFASIPPGTYSEPGPHHSDAWMRLLGWQDQIKAAAFAAASSSKISLS
jgi:hypothetical protein